MRAKGLEWPHVMLVSCVEGLLPFKLDEENELGTNAESIALRLQEERRLMYVAITRARQRLYLCFSQTRMLHGQTRYNVRSRFLAELPETALKWLTPKNQGFGGGSAKEYQSAWSRSAGPFEKPAYVEPPLPKAMVKQVDKEHGGLRVGKSVFHTKFGEGLLLTLEGVGTDARAQVNFGRHGMKWLALSIAKLTPID